MTLVRAWLLLAIWAQDNICRRLGQTTHCLNTRRNFGRAEAVKGLFLITSVQGNPRPFLVTGFWSYKILIIWQLLLP